jgi:hypothetical protein
MENGASGELALLAAKAFAVNGLPVRDPVGAGGVRVDDWLMDEFYSFRSYSRLLPAGEGFRNYA